MARRMLVSSAVIMGLFVLFYNEKAAVKVTKIEEKPRIIFFIRTSPEPLEPFELCALYSAAIHNRRKRVVLLTISNATFKLPKYLHDTNNIQQVCLSLDQLFADTPDHKWYQNRGWDSLENNGIKRARLLSDAIRVAYLYKNGGIYMDTDIISRKSIPENLTNGVTCQPICNGFLIFDPKHEFLWTVMQEHARKFNPAQSENEVGVALFHRVYTKMVAKGREVPNIFPVERLIPIAYENAQDLFKPKSEGNSQVLANAITVHIWRNKLRSLLSQHPIAPKKSLLRDLMFENCAPVMHANIAAL